MWTAAGPYRSRIRPTPPVLRIPHSGCAAAREIRGRRCSGGWRYLQSQSRCLVLRLVPVLSRKNRSPPPPKLAGYINQNASGKNRASNHLREQTLHHIQFRRHSSAFSEAHHSSYATQQLAFNYRPVWLGHSITLRDPDLICGTVWQANDAMRTQPALTPNHGDVPDLDVMWVDAFDQEHVAGPDGRKHAPTCRGETYITEQAQDLTRKFAPREPTGVRQKIAGVHQEIFFGPMQPWPPVTLLLASA